MLTQKTIDTAKFSQFMSDLADAYGGQRSLARAGTSDGSEDLKQSTISSWINGRIKTEPKISTIQKLIKLAQDIGWSSERINEYLVGYDFYKIDISEKESLKQLIKEMSLVEIVEIIKYASDQMYILINKVSIKNKNMKKMQSNQIKISNLIIKYCEKNNCSINDISMKMQKFGANPDSLDRILNNSYFYEQELSILGAVLDICWDDFLNFIEAKLF